MRMFHNPRKPRRPTHKQVIPWIGLAFQQCQDVQHLDEIVQQLEAQAIDVLAWDGLTPKQRLDHWKRENVRTFLREISLNIGGKKVRRWQCVKISQPIPDSNKVRVTRHWIDVGMMLVEGTRASKDTEEGASGRRQVEDWLTLTLHEYEALAHGIQVRIDGIDGVLCLVKDGNVTFQPSLLGESDNETQASA